MNRSHYWFNHHLLAVLVGLAFLVGLAAPAAAQSRAPRKKLIATGWDKPDTARLRENLAQMEQRPFDGVILEAVGTRDDGKSCFLRSTFSAQAWEQRWFNKSVEDLKACRFTRFTDNFVTVGANPGNVDWFDDEGWKNVVEHWRIAAWIAKEGGLKGLHFDPEPYTPPHAQFNYLAQPQKAQHTFAEYQAKARERGREVMRAVIGEYPDLTIFTYFMLVINSNALGHANPNAVLETSGYGLLPAFVDGWLDVIPPAVKLVDGCENAYRYNSTTQFLEAAVRIKGDCQQLISPENRAKYRAQVQAGFGIYLDAYWNPPTSQWYIDGLGEPRVLRLRKNVATALRVADEYVWIYGEKFRWWSTPNPRVNKETWPEALPGSEDALRFARDPADYGRARIATLEKEGKLANLARNADFASEQAASNQGVQVDWKQGGAPAGWSSWQLETSKGVFSWDRETGHSGKGSARAAGVGNGCFIQSYDVKPGECYAIRAMRRIQGKGNTWIRVRWQTAQGRWTLEELDKTLTTEGPANEWSEIFGVVEVPEGAGKLVVLLGMAGQSTQEDVVWFDDVGVYRVD